MASVWSSLSNIPDPRTGNAQRHKLLDVLTIALVASICGAESCVDFADFARDREALFREFLELPGGPPSHDTFSRVFRLLDPAAFGSCFAAFLDDLGAEGTGVLAIDGKTLRRSHDRAAGKSALHVVTAFATDARIVIGQAAAGDKENEIITARRLLGLIDLEGMLVTGDAMHCQSETARIIRERGGQYLFTLKKSRPAQLAWVEAWFADPANKPDGVLTTTDADNGRIETRRHMVCHDVNWFVSDRRYPDEAPMPDLAMLGKIETSFEKDGKITSFHRYYMSSVAMDATAFAAAARAHWRIENSLHWVLDVTFDEDRARNRKDHGPENLAALRKLALNVLRKARPDISIRRKRKRSGWSDEFARSVLGQMR
jgi:predicted transposase YbfD/YdcC